MGAETTIDSLEDPSHLYSHYLEIDLIMWPFPKGQQQFRLEHAMQWSVELKLQL